MACAGVAVVWHEDNEFRRVAKLSVFCAKKLEPVPQRQTRVRTCMFARQKCHM